MPDIKTILCPVDFSEHARHALRHAVQIARWFKSTLTVYYAYSLPGVPPPMLYGGVPGPMPIEPYPPLTTTPEKTREDIVAEVTRFAATVDTDGVPVQIDVHAGSPARSILETADDRQPDLMVMGTHGHSGFDRWVLGSVTEKVLRKAPCPVLTVPPPAPEAPPDALWLMKRILCPLDFSDASLKALEYALSLAKEADAELLLTHVIEGLPDAAHWQQLSNPSIVEYLRLSEERALTRLRNVLPDDARTWCQPEEVLRTGKPHEEILRLARERDAHLIVMGVHGRNPIDLMFFGSTTHQVVRAATCPVLTLRG